MKNRRRQDANLHFNYDISLDLHGKTVEDSIYELEKVIYSGMYSSILIVHGIGTGALKIGIRNYLRSNSYIKDTFYGEIMNIPGGSGVTVIYV
jgi:DNA mismatch repair protein MutS2